MTAIGRLLGGSRESHEAVAPSRGRYDKRTPHAHGQPPIPNAGWPGNSHGCSRNGPGVVYGFGEVLIAVWAPRSHCIVHGATVPQLGRASATGAPRMAMPIAESTPTVSGPTVRTVRTQLAVPA